ncbi:hypothetical protein ACEQ8H_008564 [Pleosporales sp. CAS-2024a]
MASHSNHQRSPPCPHPLHIYADDEDSIASPAPIVPFARSRLQELQLDTTALPSICTSTSTASTMNPDPKLSNYLTQLYTVSYLVFFAIWGTLARLGLQALTFYPGAPVIFSELWANVAGTFIIGFLAEDRRLFAAEWGNRGANLPEPPVIPIKDKARHAKVKKTIPLYIGLATGFCGSFTSFSSFIRDVFLTMANQLKAPVYHPASSSTTSTTAARNDGYSVLAVLATILVTISLCFSALQVGAHFALLVQRFMPTLSFRLTRRIIDPLFVLLGLGSWLAAMLLAIFPPHNAWRSQALFACVFAPLGCLARYYTSLLLNPTNPSFPLGTFAVNIFGTAVLAMAYDLQRLSIRPAGGVVGGSLAGCQVLQGVQDGFCGALTTVSTWIAEMKSLNRGKAYLYGGASLLVALALMLCIMGGVWWSIGWESIICGT